MKDHKDYPKIKNVTINYKNETITFLNELNKTYVFPSEETTDEAQRSMMFYSLVELYRRFPADQLTYIS